MVRYAVANTPYFCTLFNSHSLEGLNWSFIRKQRLRTAQGESRFDK
jgi:hypothetical protein